MFLIMKIIILIQGFSQTCNAQCPNLNSSELKCTVSCTCASTRRCLIRVIDFCRVSFSGGQKTGSSCSTGLGPVTMKLAIWSFRLFRDFTAGRRQKNKHHHKWRCWHAEHFICFRLDVSVGYSALIL